MPTKAWLNGLALDQHPQTLLDNDVDLVTELSDAELREPGFSQPAAATPAISAAATQPAPAASDSLDQAQHRRVAGGSWSTLPAAMMKTRLGPEPAP